MLSVRISSSVRLVRTERSGARCEDWVAWRGTEGEAEERVKNHCVTGKRSASRGADWGARAAGGGERGSMPRDAPARCARAPGHPSSPPWTYLGRRESQHYAPKRKQATGVLRDLEIKGVVHKVQLEAAPALAVLRSVADDVRLTARRSRKRKRTSSTTKPRLWDESLAGRPGALGAAGVGRNDARWYAGALVHRSGIPLLPGRKAQEEQYHRGKAALAGNLRPRARRRWSLRRSGPTSHRRSASSPQTWSRVPVGAGRSAV